MKRTTSPAGLSATTRTAGEYVLHVGRLWWANPFWVALILVGGTAAYATILNDASYLQWGTPKFLTGREPAILFAGILAFLLSLATVVRGGPASHTVILSEHQVEFLWTAYRWFFRLTILAYAAWFLIALGRGLGAGDVLAIFYRDPQAVYRVKAIAEPVAGVTTLTQLGPVAVVVGYLLRHIGAMSDRRYLWIVALAAVRMLVLSERLALIEVLVPFITVAALTAAPNSPWHRRARYLPVLAGPGLLAIFAAAEYNRSWVHYQVNAGTGFVPWVLGRMLGYYATSYNNSAVFAQAYPEQLAPVFSIQALWNFPGASRFIGTSDAHHWWNAQLTWQANEEFNNAGSFLVVYAEWGLVPMLMFFAAAGLAVGTLHRRLSNGSLSALIALPVVLVGVMELPRILYWTEGRFTPAAAALSYLMLGLGRPLLDRTRSPSRLRSAS